MNGTEVRDRKLEGFEARLLPVLREVVEERARMPVGGIRRRPRRLRRAGGVLLVAAAAVMLTTVAVPGDDTVEVSARDAVADARGVARMLRSEGIDARILVVPVDHPVTPVWWHLWFAPGVRIDDVEWAKVKAQVGVGALALPEELLGNGSGVEHRRVLEVPRGLPGPVTLVVGRAARPGEVLGAMDNELAPDGAFYCMNLPRLDPEDARRALERLGYQVLLVQDTSKGSVEVDTVPEGAGLYWAWFRSPDIVDLRFTSVHVDEARAGEGTPLEGEAPPDWAPHC